MILIQITLNFVKLLLVNGYYSLLAAFLINFAGICILALNMTILLKFKLELRLLGYIVFARLLIDLLGIEVIRPNFSS
jgi:hypothetical protein